MSVYIKLKDDKGREVFVTDFDSQRAIDLEGMDATTIRAIRANHADHADWLADSIGISLVALAATALPPTDEEKAARAYSNVLGVINPGASNLSGVAKSFGEDVIAIRRAEALDTPGTNKHPLVQLYLHQLAFLATGRELLTRDEYDNAMAWCRAKKGGADE